MAKVLEQIENGAAWPEGLTAAAVPLIPKEGGGTSPDQLQPITILPVIYRAWAGQRYDHLKKWQDDWADPTIFGEIEEREAVQAALESALDIEEAILADESLYAALLDYSKFFDLLPWEILRPLAEWWGAPKQIIGAIKNFYLSLISRFKIGTHFGLEWGRTNSVAQGCPLSIMWANLIGAV